MLPVTPSTIRLPERAAVASADIEPLCTSKIAPQHLTLQFVQGVSGLVPRPTVVGLACAACHRCSAASLESGLPRRSLLCLDHAPPPAVPHAGPLRTGSRR